MPARPYRDPAVVDPDPPPDPASELPRLGPLRSTHAPPPLYRSLAGPVLLAGFLLGMGTIAGAPLPAVAPIALVALAILAWSPLSLRGWSADLHAHGLVLSKRGARRVVAFEDVNEVWFEIDTFHNQAGAYLHAMRILDFAGEVHRVPLALIGSAAIVTSVLRECSAPLLVEARQALREGTTLTFGRVQLDRTRITVNGARAAWREIRLAVLQRGTVYLYRRFPILSWRKVHLDRIPNPTVFLGLVAANVARMRVDDAFLLPLAEAMPRNGTTGAGIDQALRDMLVGGTFFLVGAGITWATYAAHGSSYILAYGPILFGAFRFLRGLIVYVSRSRR
jgi:hypothetical protein